MSNLSFLIIDIYSDTATFRIPEYHNYHKTLPLPPFTTLVGLAGAALGLDYSGSQKYFEENKFYLGVFGKSDGFTRDLWKALSSKKENRDTIIKREVNIKNKYLIVYGSESSQKIDELYKAFTNPKFSLTMGSSDSLAKIIHLEIIDHNSIEETNIFQNCILFGIPLSHLHLDIENLKEGEKYVFKTSYAPISFNLPKSFNFPEKDIRKIKERCEYIFVRFMVKSDIKLPTVKYKFLNIPFFEHNI